MTTEDPVTPSQQDSHPPNSNPDFGEVIYLVMLVPRGIVLTPPVKDIQQKRTPTTLYPWKPMVFPGRAQAHSPRRGLNPENQKRNSKW